MDSDDRSTLDILNAVIAGMAELGNRQDGADGILMLKHQIRAYTDTYTHLLAWRSVLEGEQS